MRTDLTDQRPKERETPARMLVVLWALMAAFLVFSGVQLDRRASLSSDTPSPALLTLSGALASASELTGAARLRDNLNDLRNGVYASPPTVAARHVETSSNAASERSSSRSPDAMLRSSTGTADSRSDAVAQAGESVNSESSRPRPRRILLVGASSIQIEFGMSLERELERYDDVTVLRFGRHSTGLARPDYFDWTVKAEQLVESFDPDLVIAQMAGNDGQPLSDHRGLLVAPFRADRQEWDRLYLERVEAFARIFADRDIALVMLGMPVMRGRTHTDTMRRLNTITETAADATGARYLSTWSLTDDGAGNYREMVEVNGRRYIFRAEDGIHMSVLGADVLAQDVVGELSETYDFGERDE